MVLFKPRAGGFHGFFFVEGNPQGAFSLLPVIVDSDVFYINTFGCQDYGTG